jgi:hypothetical protein
MKMSKKLFLFSSLVFLNSICVYCQNSLTIGPEIDISFNKDLLCSLRVFIQVDDIIINATKISDIKIKENRAVVLVFFRRKQEYLGQNQIDKSYIHIGVYRSKFNKTSIDNQIGENGYIYFGKIQENNIIKLSECSEAYNFYLLNDTVKEKGTFDRRDGRIIMTYPRTFIDVEKQIRLYRVYKKGVKTNSFLLQASFKNNNYEPTEYYFSNWDWDLEEE